MIHAPAVSLPALLIAALLLVSCTGTDRTSDANGPAAAHIGGTDTQTVNTGQDAPGATCKPACGDARADKLFLDSVKLLIKANDKNVDLLQEALNKLKEIRDCLPCSNIAAALSAPRGFGDISIEKLERKISIRRGEIPGSCRCSPLNGALKTAMGLETHYVRDDTIASIARKLVRRTDDFGCGLEIVGLVGDDKKRSDLREYIARTRIKIPFDKGGCGACREQVQKVGERDRSRCG